MRSPWLIVFLAAIGAVLILTFTFVRPPEPGKAGLRPPEVADPPSAPPGPTVAAIPEPLPELKAPGFDIVRISSICTAVIAGSAEASMLITVKSGERELGRVTADKDGEWVLVPDLPLEAGTHLLTLIGTVQGRDPVSGKDGVSVVVPACRPGEADRSEQAVAVLTQRAGGTRLLEPTVTGSNGGLVKGLVLDTADYDEAGQLALSGRAKPSRVVQVYINNQPIGAATADKHGRWSLSPKSKIDPGIYTIRVDQVQDTGRIAARVELPINRGRREERITVRPGDNLWELSRRAYGDGMKAEAIYQANKSRIKDPNTLYPGQVLVLPPSDGKSAKPTRTSPASSR